MHVQGGNYRGAPEPVRRRKGRKEKEESFCPSTRDGRSVSTMPCRVNIAIRHSRPSKRQRALDIHAPRLGVVIRLTVSTRGRSLEVARSEGRPPSWGGGRRRRRRRFYSLPVTSDRRSAMGVGVLVRILQPARTN